VVLLLTEQTVLPLDMDLLEQDTQKTGMSSSKTPSGTGFSNDSLGSTKGGATLASFGITPANKGQTV